jgi:ribosomal protein S21
MIKVIRREHESIDDLIVRFRGKVNESGILKELKERAYFESKGEKRRRLKKQRNKELLNSPKNTDK